MMFNTSEHRTLLGFFREEAREGLTRIASLFLAASSTKPNKATFDELMRLTHSLKGAAGTVDLPLIADLIHRYEGAIESLMHDKIAWTLSLRDILVEISDELWSVLVDTTRSNRQDSSQVQAVKKLLQQVAVTDSSPLESKQGGDRRQAHADRRSGPVPERGGAPLLRVDPARIDRLMESAGELVLDRNRIENRVVELSREFVNFKSTLSNILTAEHSAENTLLHLERLLKRALPILDTAIEGLSEDTDLLRRTEFALQDGLTSVRMQSVRALFQSLSPQLRSIARHSNRRVRMTTVGGETEFDKTVADVMVDPLIQLLRNAVAHGIEAPDERAKLGKSSEGRITLAARQEGNVVVLEISDDGRGIDTEQLRRLMVERGKWSEQRAQVASDADVLRLLFSAGYTSLSSADELAGRGVGLNTVHETVTRLGGEVVVSSVLGQGTTFSMRLPLTTATANAMLFKIHGHVFAIPNVHVVASSDLSDIHRSTFGGIPHISLHKLLGFPEPDESTCSVMLLEYLGKRLAVRCDKIIGAKEIVLKSLGPMLSMLSMFAGGTISPSGKVQLILDPAVLVNLAYSKLSLAERERAGKRVLVVDDSKVIREAMRGMLEELGYSVRTAMDGNCAWELLLEHRVDLLLTDIEMPGGGGFELLKRVRNHPELQGMSAIVISSRANADNRKKANEFGVLGILPKPVSIQDLRVALHVE